MKWQVKTHSGSQLILQICCAYPNNTKTESGETELRNIGKNTQRNNDLIIHNTIINERLNQISDMIKGFPHFTRKLDNVT